MEVSYACVFICVPSGPSVCASFSTSLMALTGYLARTPLPNHDKARMGFCNPRGSDLVMQRTSAVWHAMDGGATHILWLDSDMIFPQDTLHRLMAHDKAIVAANYAGKAKEHKVVTQNADYADADGADAVFSFGKTGLEKAKRTGLGCCLVRMDIFFRIDYPWFGHKWEWIGPGDPQVRVKSSDSPLRSRWKSAFEDWWFFRRVEDAGIDLWIDHDLSNEIGHIGGAVFHHGGWEHCEAGR